MKGLKWLGIMVAVALIVAMCVVPVSASPCGYHPGKHTGTFCLGDAADSHHAERHGHGNQCQRPDGRLFPWYAHGKRNQ